MNPQFPVYVVSKGRSEWNLRLTSRALESMRVPYRIIVEQSEREAYAAAVGEKKILVLDPQFQKDYDTFDRLGDSKGKGPGPARNFAWEHSIAEGAAFHWVMDDNIRVFRRLQHARRIAAGDGTIFKCMEDFCLRYKNIAMAGPNYEMFVVHPHEMPPFILNTRIYSCNLIRNDVDFRWRGRYNEDTDLSLRMLKRGWCTVQFNAFLQKKITTQLMAGGNTKEFYSKEGTLAKSQMLAAMHPDCARLKWRFGRIHHLVNYRQFKTPLVLRDGIALPEGVDDYGMRLAPRAFGVVSAR